MVQTSAPPRPRLDTGTRKYQEMLAGFRVYLLPSGAGDALPKPRAYTCYRGVPVASEAIVVDADATQVTFKVNRYQANALARTQFALVKSPLHGMTFRAYLSRLDADAFLASFDLFERHNDGAERRGNVRFQPLEDVDVNLAFGRKKVASALLDISSSAVAVFVKDADPAVLQEKADAKVSLTVAGEQGFKLRVAGQIQRILAWAGDDPNDFRVVLKLDVSEGDRTIISSYVAQQQNRILETMSQ